MSDSVDKDTLLRIAIADDDVQAAVLEACTVETLPAESSMSGEVTISRPAEPIDYANAVSTHIDKFDGLSVKDVTVKTVAPLLVEPDPDEQ